MTTGILHKPKDIILKSSDVQLDLTVCQYDPITVAKLAAHNIINVTIKNEPVLVFRISHQPPGALHR